MALKLGLRGANELALSRAEQR